MFHTENQPSKVKIKNMKQAGAELCQAQIKLRLPNQLARKLYCLQSLNKVGLDVKHSNWAHVPSLVKLDANYLKNILSRG